uniref:Pentraxin family member n=1 Tax=Strigamia maritima TaxID=126957 RepID=T1IGV3_STRMM
MDITLCYWIRPHRNGGCDVIFSYAVPKAFSFFQRQPMADETSSTKSGGHSSFGMQQDRVLLGKQSLQKYSWIHSCITWSSLEGRWQFYLNGYKYNEGTGLTIGEFIQPNGVVVLGQDQDLEDGQGGQHDVKDQMRGQISDLNLWDSVLHPDEIVNLASCESSYEGNVIGWKSATWELYDGTRIAPVKLPCIKQRHN